MKKVSTAAAMQSRNFSEQKLTVGLDLGDRSSHYSLGTTALVVPRRKRPLKPIPSTKPEAPDEGPRLIPLADFDEERQRADKLAH